MARKQEGHCIMGADATALAACSLDRPGRILILDTSSVRTEAIRYSLRLASMVGDYTLWKTFIDAIFPNAVSYLRDFVTSQNFDTLLANIQSNKITFVHSDLSVPNAYRDIANYLVAETGHSSVALIHTAYLENDISKKIVTQHGSSIDDEHVASEKELVLEKRRTALENFHDNIKALVQRDTQLVKDENNSIRLFDKVKMESEWRIGPFTPLELISKEVSEGGILAETYYMARELQSAFANILRAHSEELTTNYVPLFDTLVKNNNELDSWNLSLIDTSHPEYPARTIKTKEPIFDKISAFVRKMSVDHVTAAGSAAMTLIFSAQAICYWIESGFKPDVRGLSSGSLIAAVQIHFFVNIVSVAHGITELGYAAGVVALKQGTKGALSISALRPYVQVSVALLKVSSSGRMLMSLGRFVSKALPIIGLVVNVADLGLNIFQVVNNNDPYQKPALITNLVFSAASLTLSVAAIAASIAGFSSLGGPLAVAGIAVAALSIPVSYFVGKFTARIEVAKYIGKIIGTIAKELKHGGYKKIEERVESKLHKFLAAPSYVSITELELSSLFLRVTYGSMEYQPSNLPEHHFFDRFHADPEYFMHRMKSNIKLDGSYRTLTMPCLPEYKCVISNEHVLFSGSPGDAEFKEAMVIQQVDPGFKFQVSQLVVGDKIASTFAMYYQHTDININILESDWNLIFPWVNPDSDTEKNPDLSKNFIEDFNKCMRKISYDIRALGSGKQTIVMPGLACLVNIRLHCQHINVTWFIEFSDQSVSNQVLRVEGGKIKIGSNQNIQLLGQPSKIYLMIPKYNNLETKYQGRAYFDVTKDTYIYNKEATIKEQADARLIFSTDKHAYFYSTNQADVQTLGDEIWCVQIETKKAIFKHRGVKQLQRQGEALVFLDTRGVLYHLSADLTSQNVNCRVIGFNEDWFSQRANPSKALSDADEFLEKNPRNQVIFFRLPYHTSQALTGNILYNLETKKYFILNAKYANHATFLTFSMANQNAYYFANGQNELISVKGLNQEETWKQLLIAQNKTQLHSDQPCALLLKKVIDAHIAEKYVRARLSSGLLVILYEKFDNDIFQTHVSLEKIVVLSEEFERKADYEISSILQEKLLLLEREHFGESIKNRVQKKLPNFIGIEHNRENIGFFEKARQRTLSANQLPRVHSITPLGTDDSFAYHILNSEKIVRTPYITKLKELKVLPVKKLKDKDITFLQGEVFELFDQVLFLKKEVFENDFTDKLKVLAKLSGIDTIWLESKKYSLKMSQLENITISSFDLSQNDVIVNINLQINLFDEYYLERDNFDLYFYNPQRNCHFVFKGVFKPKTAVTSFGGVSLIVENSLPDVLNLPKVFNLSAMLNKYEQNNTPIFTYGRPSYPHIDIKSVVSVAEVEHVMDKLLWPGEERKLELFKALSWIHQNLDHEKSKNFLAYLKMYPDSFKNLEKRRKPLDNILHLSVKDGRIGIVQLVLHALQEHPNTIKALVLQGDKNGDTVLHHDARSHSSKIVEALFDGIKESVGEETVRELILKGNTSGETCLHDVASSAISSTILSFWNDIKRYCDKKTLEELVGKPNGGGQTVLHILVQRQHFEFIGTLMRDVKDTVGTQAFASLLLKTDGAGNNVLHYMATYGTYEAFKAFWEDIQIKLEKDILKEIILKKNATHQTFLNILSGRQQNDSVQLSLVSVGKLFGKETVNELLSN